MSPLSGEHKSPFHLVFKLTMMPRASRAPPRAFYGDFAFARNGPSVVGEERPTARDSSRIMLAYSLHIADHTRIKELRNPTRYLREDGVGTGANQSDDTDDDLYSAMS